jgi:hypothetical protein
MRIDADDEGRRRLERERETNKLKSIRHDQKLVALNWINISQQQWATGSVEQKN